MYSNVLKKRFPETRATQNTPKNKKLRGGMIIRGRAADCCSCRACRAHRHSLSPWRRCLPSRRRAHRHSNLCIFCTGCLHAQLLRLVYVAYMANDDGAVDTKEQCHLVLREPHDVALEPHLQLNTSIVRAIYLNGLASFFIFSVMPPIPSLSCLSQCLAVPAASSLPSPSLSYLRP